jgi:hypothetical protein
MVKVRSIGNPVDNPPVPFFRDPARGAVIAYSRTVLVRFRIPDDVLKRK